MEGALWSNDALRGQLVDATRALDSLLGDAAARLLRPDPKRRMTAEQLRRLLSGVGVAEEAVEEALVEKSLDEDVMCLLRGLGQADEKTLQVLTENVGVTSIGDLGNLSASELHEDGLTRVQAKSLKARFDAEMRVRELADAAAAKAGHGDEAGALGACLIAADELVRLSPLMPSVGTKVQACRAKLAQVEEAAAAAAKAKAEAAAKAKAEAEAKAAKAKAEAAAKAKAEAEAKAQKERAAAAEAEAAARRQRQAAAAAEEASATKKKGLSAAEQKKQNEALYDAAKQGEMGKLEAAIAAGAEVDWHNPGYVSELSELE